MSQVEEVRIQPTVYVEVTMPSGVVQVFERPAYAEVAAVGPQGGAGPSGVDGLPGPTGPSAILGTWHGAWTGTAQYPSLGMVQHQGSTYLNASLYNTSDFPNAEEPPAAPWELVAAKGEDAQPFRYIHTQSIAAATWTVIHGLSGFPNVTAIDSANSEIVGDLLYIDNTTLVISFSSPTAGKAYVS